MHSIRTMTSAMWTFQRNEDQETNIMAISKDIKMYSTAYQKEGVKEKKKISKDEKVTYDSLAESTIKAKEQGN